MVIYGAVYNVPQDDHCYYKRDVQLALFFLHVYTSVYVGVGCVWAVKLMVKLNIPLKRFLSKLKKMKTIKMRSVISRSPRFMLPRSKYLCDLGSCISYKL